MKTLGAVTIGQAPRTDLEDDLATLSREGIRVVQAGALDGMSAAEIARYVPEPGDYVLVSRMRDGSQVRLSRRKIVPLLQKKIEELSDGGVASSILLCSCEFPEMDAMKGLVIQPSKILFGVVAALALGARLAVAMPTPEQVEPARAKWGAVSGELLVLSASPYVSPKGQVESAVRTIHDWHADLCVMDCAGFPLWMKEAVRAGANVPVLSALGVTVRVAAELSG